MNTFTFMLLHYKFTILISHYQLWLELQFNFDPKQCKLHSVTGQDTSSLVYVCKACLSVVCIVCYDCHVSVCLPYYSCGYRFSLQEVL